MFSIIGILVVVGSVLGGFLMEKGKLPVLIQPSEFLTIAGAALGTLVAANPMHVLKGVGQGVAGVLKGGAVPEKRYVESLKMLFDVFTKGKKGRPGCNRGGHRGAGKVLSSPSTRLS